MSYNKINLTEPRELSFEERLSLLVERERAIRDTKGLQRRLSAARLKLKDRVRSLGFLTAQEGRQAFQLGFGQATAAKRPLSEPAA